MDGGARILSRNVTAIEITAVGRVAQVDGDALRVVLLDATGEPVREVSDFLSSLLASGSSPGSLRSYAMDLLRWWRFLAAVDVSWHQAGPVEARDFVLWMRLVGPPGRPGGYAPATINHALAVIKGFYEDRIRAGDGPLVNPIPSAEHRAGR